MRTMGLGLGKDEQHQAAVSLLLPLLVAPGSGCLSLFACSVAH